MSKVFPGIHNINIDSSVVTNSIDIHKMTDTSILDYSGQCIPPNPMTPNFNCNQSHENVVIPIKEECNSKDGNSHQVSAFVKFIKNSFTSHKKKSDINVMNNQKLIGSLKNNSQINNQNDNSNSESSDPTFIPSLNSSNDLSCRFCQEYEPANELVTPCLCSGTMKYIHQSCLQRWIKTQDNRFCELCKYEFHMKITTKPLREWQRLEMSVMERRKVICSVTFHVIALTCVIWSLYVLIERTNEEMRDGRLEWPFWTKLIVVAIGFIGGIVFMYVQCRMYVSLCRKWHAFNRTFVVQNISSTDRITAQKHAKEKAENFQKTASAPANVYGDVSSDRTIVRNINNTGLAPIASSSNEDLNYSFSTVCQSYIGDSRQSIVVKNVPLSPVSSVDDLSKHPHHYHHHHHPTL